MFDGTDDYVDIPSEANFDFANGIFSVTAWVKLTGTLLNPIISKRSGGNSSWEVGIINGRPSLTFAAVGDYFAPSGVVNDGNWHYVVVAVSGNGGTVRMYADGIEVYSTTVGTVNTNNANASIGYSPFTGGKFFGQIDSVSVYSRALSASEILSNYNVGNIQFQTRTGNSATTDDGTWEPWKPTIGENQLLSMDSDAANWDVPNGIDGYTKLLLHMDGTDAATTFTDSALSPKPLLRTATRKYPRRSPNSAARADCLTARGIH